MHMAVGTRLVEGDKDERGGGGKKDEGDKKE
jgi:hypothetical protein